MVLTDLAPDMLAVARRRRSEAGLRNATEVACSADALPFAPATFATISVRFGFMFFPELQSATDELVRVLAPGGRLAASVWVRPEDNPWTSIVMRAIGQEVDLPVPAPGAPSMFRCAADGCVGDLYRVAGLSDVEERDVGLALVTSSPEEYWQVASEHMSLAVWALGQVDAPARQRIERAVVRAATDYEDAGAVRVPGLARVVVGTKPVGIG